MCSWNSNPGQEWDVKKNTASYAGPRFPVDKKSALVTQYSPRSPQFAGGEMGLVRRSYTQE